MAPGNTYLMYAFPTMPTFGRRAYGHRDGWRRRAASPQEREHEMWQRLAVATAVPAAIAVLPAASVHAEGLPTLTCAAHTLPVAIADPGPADQTMWGQLCYRGSREPTTVQLLVHGATYNHLYWDFPHADGYYSYVDAATAAGYATFDVDRIGDGNSSHPPSADVTLTAGAIALHDAVTALRTGAVDGHPFQHVIMVGHSLGSFEAWIEEALYHDVNAMIITGALHALTPSAPANVGNDFYPAVDDPKFAGSGLDPGYLTTRPGTRESLFYEPATADPAVVALDEDNKDTNTVAELDGLLSLLAEPATQQPSYQDTVPVLVMVGAEDNIFCAGVTVYNCASGASVRSYESQYYPPQAHLRVAVIPDTGHDLALSTTAPITDAAMIGWSLATVTP
jgi:alpha-beta hydrolase superfamily lysophospholipase